MPRTRGWENIDIEVFYAVQGQEQIHNLLVLVRVMLSEFSSICTNFFIDHTDNFHSFITIANQWQTPDVLVRVRISRLLTRPISLACFA